MSWVDTLISERTLKFNHWGFGRTKLQLLLRPPAHPTVFPRALYGDPPRADIYHGNMEHVSQCRICIYLRSDTYLTIIENLGREGYTSIGMGVVMYITENENPNTWAFPTAGLLVTNHVAIADIRAGDQIYRCNKPRSHDPVGFGIYRGRQSLRKSVNIIHGERIIARKLLAAVMARSAGGRAWVGGSGGELLKKNRNFKNIT